MWEAGRKRAGSCVSPPVNGAFPFATFSRRTPGMWRRVEKEKVFVEKGNTETFW